VDSTIELTAPELTNSVAVFRAIEGGSGRIGKGVAYGHHGEIVQGAMRGDDHRIQRFLVTLPCDEIYARATFEPSRALAGQIVASARKGKSRKAVEATLRHLGHGSTGGQLHLTGNIDEGFGLGSSTADVVASIRAVGDAFSVVLPPETVAKLAVEAETASDAIMFDNSCVLFAQRRGIVLSYLGSDLPALHVISVNTAKDAPVDTLDLPAARYCDWELQCFRALCGMLRRAIRTSDPYLLGRVATASAEISEKRLPKPGFADIVAISRSNGACGVQVSHSGTVAGLLFDAHDAGTGARMDAAARDLASVGLSPDFQFSTRYKRNRHAL
jgi:uncharacterized protein involved in propanediol utilization